MRIHKLAAIVLAAALIIPNMAEAYPKQGWYVGLGGGVGFQQDSDAIIGGITNVMEFDPGFVLNGNVGYGFENQLRPEFEVSYRRNNVDAVSGTGSGTNNGHEDALAFMGNLFYDFDTRSGLTPYIGAGAGAALVAADNAGFVVGGTTLNSQPLRFAYQGIAGLAYEISERLDISADYRYFATMEPEFKTAAGVLADETSYNHHSFLIGLRYVFGVPRRTPEPVAMRAAPRPVMVMPAAPVMRPMMVQPMAPPPPPVVPETYIVFFDFDKYYLTTEAKDTIQRAADAYRSGNNPRVEVTGHTDTRGNPRYNRRLSERRSKIVKDYMVSLGVQASDITTRGAGEGELMIPTANSTREAKNRRAEIVLRQ